MSHPVIFSKGFAVKSLQMFLINCFAAIFIFCFSSCSPVTINTVDAHIQGDPSQVTTTQIFVKGTNGRETRYEELQPIAEHNQKVLSWYREKESQLYKGEHQGTSNYERRLPKVCLALSGGGIRSAAYSIGVMKGLHEKKILEKIDIISAVSGGAYALSWLYTMNSNRNRMDEIFKGDEAINKLAGHANMYTWFDFLQAGVLNTALIPINFLANGVVGWHANTTPARANYEYEIRKLFQQGNEATLEETEEWIRGNDLPYFIINTTVKIDDDRFHHASELSNSIFEITPLRFGSDAFGYKYKHESDTFPFTFSRAVSISGAAADSSAVPGEAQKVFFSALNHDLGFYIDNYTAEYKKQKKWWTKFIPFPFYFFSPSYLRDKVGTDIYLSDGGHSENLGAFALIRRACDDIYIVDAEYDKDYQFEAYFKLKEALKREMGVTLAIKTIDEMEKKRVCRKEDENGNCIRVAEVKKDFKFAKRSQCKDPNISLFTPIVKGTVSAFPIPNLDDEHTITEKVLNVTYIKLAIDEALLNDVARNPNLQGQKHQAVERFGTVSVEYYIKSKDNDCGNILLDCEFPQYSTVDQSYTPEQFLAYVDLGYYNVMNYLSLNQTNLVCDTDESSTPHAS